MLAPALLATEAALIPISIAGGWFGQKLLAWADTLQSLRRLLRERRGIQKRRKATAGEFAAGLTADLDSAYLGPAARSRLLRAALRGYWAIALALVGGRPRGG